jgi:hypothetical protein
VINGIQEMRPGYKEGLIRTVKIVGADAYSWINLENEFRDIAVFGFPCLEIDLISLIDLFESSAQTQ